MPTSAIRCPACGHQLLIVDLPAPTAAPSPGQDANASEPLMLRVSDAARLLNVSRSTMYQLVTNGDVNVIRIGRSVRVPRAELVRLVDRSS